MTREEALKGKRTKFIDALDPAVHPVDPFFSFICSTLAVPAPWPRTC